MADPIVVMIASYKEGKLVQGAIRSALKCKPAHVIACDAAIEGLTVEGEATDFGQYKRYRAVTFKSFPAQHIMRQSMLETAKIRMRGKPFWILTLDADEILVWGEYLPDWLNQLKPGYPKSAENVIPLKMTGIQWREGEGFKTFITPSRVVHSSLIGKYLCGQWVFESPDGNFATLGHLDSEAMPAPGEPHIHHRPYMRRPERQAFRVSGKSEEDEFKVNPEAYMKKWHGVKGFQTPEYMKRLPT